MLRACSFVFFNFFIVIIMALCYSCDATKCTESDSRNIYDSCALDYRSMTLWCDYTNFTLVPHPRSIESQAPCERAIYLFFNNSCLEKLNPDAIHQYRSLRSADFSDNQLTKICNKTFLSTRHLKTLDLSKNNISEIEAKAFQNLNNLKELNLSSNNISNLPAKIFYNMHKLNLIVIDYNSLTSVSTEWFQDRVNLTTLSVQNNHLDSWFAPKPKQLHHLQVIKAGSNNLKTFHRRNFNHLPLLGEVYFSGNKLHRVDHDTFHGNQQLEVVDLSNNHLETLPKRLFRHHCKLRALKLDGNRFKTMHPDWFVHPLHHNSHYAIQTRGFLKTNNWNCDCNVVDYWKFLKELNSSSLAEHHQLSKVLDFECFVPAEFHGIELSKLTRRQLCGIDPSYDYDVVSDQDQYLRTGSLVVNPIEKRRKDCKVQPSLAQAVPTKPIQVTPEYSNQGNSVAPLALNTGLLGIIMAIGVILKEVLLMGSRKQPSRGGPDSANAFKWCRHLVLDDVKSSPLSFSVVRDR